MSNTYTDPLPMPEDDSLPAMPAMPRMGESGPQVCAAVQLYLGVLNDLPAEQGEIIREHVRTCAGCTAVERLIQSTTDIIGGLPASMPSARVDEAVREAVAARGKGRGYVASLRGGDASVPTVTRATQASPPRIHTTPAPTGLSTGGFLGRIVTFVGAGEGRSGVGTLASPMEGRWEATGKQDTGRPKGPHLPSLPPPPPRDIGVLACVGERWLRRRWLRLWCYRS